MLGATGRLDVIGHTAPICKSRDAVRELQSQIGIPANKVADKIKVTVTRGWLTLPEHLAESAVKKSREVTGVTDNIEMKPRVSPTAVKRED